MRGRPTRVAVVQLDGHPAAVLPASSEPLEDPLFGAKDKGETLPTPGEVAEELAVVAGTHAVTRAARKDGVYGRLGGAPPPALEAVAPVLHRGKLLALTSKLHAAKPERGALREAEQWSAIELPPDLDLPSPLGVVICLDFLVAPGAQPDKITRDKLQQARLLAVPSWPPTHTLREFEAAAWVSAARGRTPVLYANVAAQGGSTIYVDKEHGQAAGRFPQQIGRLDAGDEGVVVVDVDLSDQRRGSLTPYLDGQIVTPIAQASLVYPSHPAAPELLRRIQTTYDLRDLARRPLLLGMVLKTLEHLPTGQRVTQAVLYEQYLQRWLDNANIGDREVFTDAQKRAFAETLAEALWRTGATSLGWEALQDTVRARLFRELPEDMPPGSALLEIAGGAFFVRAGDDQYRFAHKSFLE